MTPWTESEEAALEAAGVRFGVFFLLRTTPEVRLWAGIGDCEGEINAIDATSQVYRGVGTLEDIPAVQAMINGRAERITFRLSTYDQQVITLARGETSNIKRKTVHLGFGVFNPDWQLAGPVRWIWRGRADYMREIREETTSASGSPQRSIELSVGSLFTSRKRPGLSFFTDADQRARHPGDAFCERTPNYTQEFQKEFSAN